MIAIQEEVKIFEFSVKYDISRSVPVSIEVPFILTEIIQKKHTFYI